MYIAENEIPITYLLTYLLMLIRFSMKQTRTCSQEILAVIYFCRKELIQVINSFLRESVLTIISTSWNHIFFFFFRPKNHAVYWLLVILQFASKNMPFIVFYHMIHVQQKRHSEPEFQKQLINDQKIHSSLFIMKVSFICITYTGAHISWHELFLAGNQGNH